MKYETVPIEVEACQQQIVSAHVPIAPNGIATANPGDWIVKWPDGRLEVYNDVEFRKQFRTPPPPFQATRGLLERMQNGGATCEMRPTLGGVMVPVAPIDPLTPRCGEPPCPR